MSSNTALPIIDSTVFEECYLGDLTLFREVLDVFLETHPKQIEELIAQIAAQNAEGARSAAHKLKGGLLNLAAAEAAEVAKNIEIFAQENRFSDAATEISHLKERITVFLEECDRRFAAEE